MIKQEIFEDNPDLIRTYSTAGFKILQVDTGAIYDEAIDIATTTHTYEETDEKIDSDEEEEESLQEALDIIFGK